MKLTAITHARALRCVLAGAIAAVLATAPVRTATSQSARETRDRHVTMTVLDKKDSPVTDLTVNDVVVREDGVTREISRVGRATAPMQIVLLADDSAAATPMPAELQKGLGSFVGNVLTASPDSEIQLMTFGERPTTQTPFTTSQAVLRQGVTRVFPHAGAGAYLLEAITESTKALMKKKATRAVIVAFVAEDGPEFSNETHDMIEKALKNAGASLWTIAVQARQPSDSIAQRERAQVVNDVAIASGGGNKMILDRQGVDRAFTEVATWITSQVEVTYSRPDRLIPPSKLEVTVKRPDVHVWAPRWTGAQ